MIDIYFHAKKMHQLLRVLILIKKKMKTKTESFCTLKHKHMLCALHIIFIIHYLLGIGKWNAIQYVKPTDTWFPYSCLYIKLGLENVFLIWKTKTIVFLTITLFIVVESGNHCRCYAVSFSIAIICVLFSVILDWFHFFLLKNRPHLELFTFTVTFDKLGGLQKAHCHRRFNYCMLKLSLNCLCL